MKLIEQKIQILDVPNKNGRIYSSESIQKILDQKKEIVGCIDMSQNGIVDLCKISHFCEDLKIKDGWLVCSVRVLDTHYGKILKETINTGFTPDFRISGFGKVQADGTVTELEIRSIDAVQDGA